MPWPDRLREAAYTSPSGTRATFSYENVRKEFDKKTAAFEFPDADGTYIQDLGRAGDRYPLRIFFWGADYDLEAANFEALLVERGVGLLEHPIYGAVSVVPFGAISRRDDLKTAANQAIFEVTFWATIGLIYPSSQVDPTAAVITSVDAFNTASAEDFAEGLNLQSVTDEVNFRGVYNTILGQTAATLQPIADTQDDVRTQFNAIKSSIENGIDVLIAEPTTLAFQTSLLVQAPARALTSIQARLSGYGDLIASIVEDSPLVSDVSRLHAGDLYASSYITGSILSTVNTTFTTKTEALTAASEILEQFESVVAWRDNNFEALDEIDTGGAYQKLQAAAAIAAGFLVEISFNLKQERRLVLDRDRTYIDLTAELYGAVDSELDFFIASNDLSGDEMFELPKGREIVYYV